MNQYSRYTTLPALALSESPVLLIIACAVLWEVVMSGCWWML